MQPEEQLEPLEPPRYQVDKEAATSLQPDAMFPVTAPSLAPGKMLREVLPPAAPHREQGHVTSLSELAAAGASTARPESDAFAADQIAATEVDGFEDAGSRPALPEQVGPAPLNDLPEVAGSMELIADTLAVLAQPPGEMQTALEPPQVAYFSGELVLDSVFTDETGHSVPVPEVLLDVAPAEAEELSAAVPPAVGRQLEHYLASVEPAERETVGLLIDTLSQAAENIKHLPATEADQLERAEQAVQELCEQLLDCLGVAYTDETVKQLVRTIVAAEPGVAMAAEEGQLSIEELNALGTQEHQQDDGLSLTQFLQHKLPPCHLLGKFALQSA